MEPIVPDASPQKGSDAQPSADSMELKPKLLWSSPRSIRNFLFFCIAAFVDRHKRNVLVRSVGSFIRIVVPGVTPETAQSLRNQFKRGRLLSIGIVAFLATIIVSYIFALIASWSQGTLFATERYGLNFLRDWHNAAIYTLIAPLYVAFSVVIIYLNR